MEFHGRHYECQTCGLAISRSFGLGSEIGQGRGLDLSLEEVGDS